MITQVITREGVATALERRRISISCERGPAAGRRLESSADRISIGSASHNDLALDDPSVSRQHARLEVTDDGLLLRDLASTNGTFAAGLRVLAAYLPEQARVRLGESELDIRVSDQVDTLPLSERPCFARLHGHSIAMRRVFALLERVAAADSPVLIEGESGTGKELAAEALHEASSRRDGPLVIVDCGALPGSLIESELFGHERGAFTGAIAPRAGAFEIADGGTVFLDELGELELSLQSRLLRVLDRGRVKRVGGDRYTEVNVRVVAATNRDLERAVAAGEFREDLYYRVAVMRVHMPALRQRADDIELLARRFIDEFRQRHPRAPGFELTPEITAALRQRPWRGNVRELRNFIERAVVLAAPDLVEVDRSGAEGSGEIAYHRPYAEARDQWVSHFEREYVKAALDRSGGNVAAAARECAIDRAYLFRLLKKHEVDR